MKLVGIVLLFALFSHYSDQVNGDEERLADNPITPVIAEVFCSTFFVNC